MGTSSRVATHGNRVVLIVDDDPDVRETLGEVLRDEGYATLAASHGAEALDQLRAGARPDVILLDLMMPVMDGWEFRARQRDEPAWAHIPVVVITASGHAAAQTAVLAPAAVLRKPISLEGLLAAVAGVA